LATRSPTPGSTTYDTSTPRRYCAQASRSRVVAARLGHADPSITLRVYAHIISDQLTEAADIFARAIADAR
jgi:integrase